MVLVLLKQRGKSDSTALTIEKKEGVTVKELKAAIQAKIGLQAARQRLTNDSGLVLEDDSKDIKEYKVGGTEGSVTVKDLGKQICELTFASPKGETL